MKANSSRNSMFSLSEKRSSRTAWTPMRSASVAVMTRGTLKTGSDPALKHGLVVREKFRRESADLARRSSDKALGGGSRMRRLEIGRWPALGQAVTYTWDKNEGGAYRPHGPPLPAKCSAPNDRARP